MGHLAEETIHHARREVGPISEYTLKKPLFFSRCQDVTMFVSATTSDLTDLCRIDIFNLLHKNTEFEYGIRIFLELIN
jgi:serine/threonine protein kinase HipA of HipAB toxin-antitoxin module